MILRKKTFKHSEKQSRNEQIDGRESILPIIVVLGNMVSQGISFPF